MSHYRPVYASKINLRKGGGVARVNAPLQRKFTFISFSLYSVAPPPSGDSYSTGLPFFLYFFLSFFLLHFFLSFFCKIIKKAIKIRYFQGRRINLNFGYLKSFKSYSQSHPLWLTLYMDKLKVPLETEIIVLWSEGLGRFSVLVCPEQH